MSLSLATLLQTTQTMVRMTTVVVPPSNQGFVSQVPPLPSPYSMPVPMQTSSPTSMQILMGGMGTMNGLNMVGSTSPPMQSIPMSMGTMNGVNMPGSASPPPTMPIPMGMMAGLPPVQTQPQMNPGLPSNQPVSVSGTPVVSTAKVDDAPTITSGPAAGNVFNGNGDSFLDPNTILEISHNFAQSIMPPNGDSAQEPFGSNPDAQEILDTTSSTLDDILKGRIQIPQIPITLVPGQFIVPVPNLNDNPTTNQLIQGTQFFLNNLLNRMPVTGMGTGTVNPGTSGTIPTVPRPAMTGVAGLPFQFSTRA